MLWESVTWSSLWKGLQPSLPHPSIKKEWLLPTGYFLSGPWNGRLSIKFLLVGWRPSSKGWAGFSLTSWPSWWWSVCGVNLTSLNAMMLGMKSKKCNIFSRLPESGLESRQPCLQLTKWWPCPCLSGSVSASIGVSAIYLRLLMGRTDSLGCLGWSYATCDEMFIPLFPTHSWRFIDTRV